MTTKINSTLIRFHHIHNGNRIAATLAYRVTSDGVEYSVACASPKDVSTRKLGNKIALGRFEENVRYTAPFKTEDCVSFRDIHMAMLESLSKNSDKRISRQTKRAALSAFKSYKNNNS